MVSVDVKHHVYLHASWKQSMHVSERLPVNNLDIVPLSLSSTPFLPIHSKKKKKKKQNNQDQLRKSINKYIKFKIKIQRSKFDGKGDLTQLRYRQKVSLFKCLTV